MSEPELAYMAGNNDDFDLPRWQPHNFQDPFSSTSQAAQAAQQAGFGPSYNVPPSSSQTAHLSHRQPVLTSSHQTQAGSTRQPRITQLLDEEQQLNQSQHQFYPTSQSQLSRSTSLSGIAGSLAVRNRRHHQPDDLERAFTSESGHNNNQPETLPQRQTELSSSQQYPSQLYNSYIATQPQTASSGPVTNPIAPSIGETSDMYQDTYYTPQSQNRRSTQHDQSPSARSPLRAMTVTSNNSYIEPYSQQSAVSSQYSTAGAYQYTNPAEMHDGLSSSTYRSQSHDGMEAKRGVSLSPMTTSYTTQDLQSPSQSSVQYSNPYQMDAVTSVSSLSPHNSTQRSALNQTPSSARHAVSTPSTPFLYHNTLNAQQKQGQYYPTPAHESSTMILDPPLKRRSSGFRRVRDHRDLRPQIKGQQQAGRRIDASGNYLSPLKQLTTHIIDTYRICNPQFRYESTHNPRRVLTKPSKPAHNEGYDNEDYDYILYVNDYLGIDQGHRYLILDVLGQGTFGQVVKCQNMKSHEIVAVKVVKNKPAYFHQSMMEVTILELLNNQCDPQDEHHILRLRDSFIHKNHLCLVFELLSSNLYELIKQNQFQGLSTQLVKVFTAQLLDALSVLKDARLIHCDLKPENILLKSLQSPEIKVIDFGSACHERQTVYTYIQSRFYRSPEVLLGIPYTAAIDMWSLGCIAVELFLGLPLFPGTSEYNQITRIVEMLGTPPTYMLELGKQAGQFFDSYVDHYGQKKYRLKSIEQYSREHNTQEQPGKQYFKASSLPDIINSAPLPSFKTSRHSQELEKELNYRASFIDFCQGLLNMNPIERWSPQQARLHPFITGEKFVKPFVVPNQSIVSQSSSTSIAGVDARRPYGGLVPSQPKGQRAYQDAAAYNQHLAQHQAFTAQAQAASQASTAHRNPYITPQSSQGSSTSSPYHSNAASNLSYSQGLADSQMHHQRQEPHLSSSGPQTAVSHSSVNKETSQLGINTSIPQYQSHTSAASSHLQPNVPSSAYFSSRNRANTVNRMDGVPPALARLQHMTQDVITGRNALTPVLNRDDAIQEWEKRRAGKTTAVQPYPQLEYLQQQAELVASGMNSWGQSGNSSRYPPGPSALSNSYQPQPPTAIVIDEPERRDAIVSSGRTLAQGDQAPTSFYSSSSSGNLTNPSQSYMSANTNTGDRYATAYPQQQPSPSSPFDSLDRRTDIGTLYVPMQPEQYQSYAHRNSHSPAQSNQPPIGTSQQSSVSSGVSSYYGSGSLQSGNQRNPFTSSAQSSSNPGQANLRETRRMSGMDNWPQ